MDRIQAFKVIARIAVFLQNISLTDPFRIQEIQGRNFQMMHLHRKEKGFSLIELLIVVAIILIIAAIAIPNLLRSRMAANESSAVGSLRTINTAEVTYSTTYPAIGFAVLANLGGAPATCATATGATSTGACLLDDVLAATAVKSGYSFAATAGGGTPSVTYFSSANPSVPGQSGQRFFCSDQSGVIRYNAAAACATTDPAL